nr:hypothetical protein [Tanacetum cinerariifolium]
MSTPKFAETLNLVTFLAKLTECEGFEQIIDFLNVSYVKYALTVNLTVYTSCIEQFWATAKKQKSKRKQRKEIEVPSPSSEILNKEGVPTTSNDPLPSGEDRMQLNELMILCTNLQKQVLNLENTAQAKEIAGLKKRVKKLEQKWKSRTSGLKRFRKVGGMNEEDMFGVNDLDGDELVVDVSASEKVEQNVKVVKKEVSTTDPVTTAVEGSEKAKEGSSKRVADKLEQEDAKRQRLKEENESAELKRCLEIIHEDDDDVTIETTPLSSESPTIVDYQIYKEERKSYFKIIRAD